MGTSLRTTFSADRGTTHWLATAASGALLMALAATLPALANEPAPAEQEADTQVVDQEPEAILGEPLEGEVVDGALDQSATDYQGVIGEPLEDVAVDQSSASFEGVIGEALEDEVVDGALDQSATDYEGIIGEPVEDEIPADE